MKTQLLQIGIVTFGILVLQTEAGAHGFGGARGGGGGGGGGNRGGESRGGGYGGSESRGGESRGAAGNRNQPQYSGAQGAAAGAAAGNRNEPQHSGAQGAAAGAAAANRNQPQYSGAAGAAAGYAAGSNYGATRFPTDAGLAAYSGAGAIATNRTTAFVSHDDMSAQANVVRANFNNYNAFTPAWNAAHPGAWATAGYAAGSAWSPATYSSVAASCSLPSAPAYYDYGNNIVYQGNNIVVNGSDPQPADQYAQQVAAVADQGRQADPPKDD